MSPELWSLYALMLKSRLFEESIAQLWYEGRISGEMHLGTGEEAIIAGVVSQLKEGDAMALDHRGTAPLLMRGVDPNLLLKEMLGLPDGLCNGMGGHMHLFSKENLAASSGIVGASGPAAAGFALAAQFANPGAIAVAFFGEGATNQGMLMESLNLASVWNLPLIFVCKDDSWSITTPSDEMSGGTLDKRVQGLGVPVLEVDGRDVGAVWEAAHASIERARSGQGPTFLHARCVHFDAHFLGYQLTRIVKNPLKELPKIAIPLTRSLLQFNGAPARDRIAGLKIVLGAITSTLRDPRQNQENDPLQRTRETLLTESERLQRLEEQIETEIASALASALAEVPA